MVKGLIGVAVAGVVLAPIALIVMGAAAISSAASTVGGEVFTIATGPGQQLRSDAPIPGPYLAYVIEGGAVCQQYGPAMLAAQIDVESNWDPNAVAHNPPDMGGDADGIAQFQQATWNTWGKDYDNSGTASQFDPGDAIPSMAHLMCSLISWAADMSQQKRLRGDPMAMALAAYTCGQGSVLAAGGVPASGQCHDYPTLVMNKLPTYGTSGNIVAVATAELNNPAHNHEASNDCNFYSGAVRTWTRGGCADATWGASEWCADFAHYVWLTAGGINVDGLDGWAQSFRAYGEAHGTFHLRSSGYVPSPGDAIVYDWDTGADAKNDPHPIDHVGIVVEVHDGRVYTIEGNTGGGDVSRNSEPLGDTQIVGYSTPVPIG